MFSPKILIIDDEPLVRDSLVEILSGEGYDVLSTQSAEKAMEIIQNEQIDIMLLDMVLPGMGGLDLLELLKQREYQGEVILMTAYSTVESAVSAIKMGAYDYLIKPCNNEEVKLLIKRIIENNSLKIENQRLREQLKKQHGLSNIISKNEKMEHVFHLIQVAASSNSTVLISGETGTGKEMVANAIHDLSTRRDKPFIKIDCASIPAEILESELFGHEKGAFTNAFAKREGRVELANTGTLFLDEIGCLPLKLQGKLLRMLQEKEFERLGSNETIKVDIRIISATNIDLEKSVGKGSFRIDLYYRLNVFHIALPPLRERKDDIPLLLNHFIDAYNIQNNKEIKGASPESLQLILDYNWPGNVRELKNYVERAVLLEQGDYITPASLPEVLTSTREKLLQDSIPDVDFRKKIKSYEKNLIENALKTCKGKKKEAAKLLGLSPRVLSYYLTKYMINKPGSDSDADE
jgi:DNA-binding NtrC family response regulator